jgi:acyl-CoA thioesterase FadM
MPRQEDGDGPTPVERFRFTLEVPNPSGEGFHLHNLAIAEILYGARNAYLARVGVDWAAMIAGGTNLVIRQVTIDFEGEVGEGVPLRSGVRAANRSNRTLTLEEVLWAPGTGLVVARARSLHVSVRLEPPAAVELPADLWARIEQFEAGGG